MNLNIWGKFGYITRYQFWNLGRRLIEGDHKQLAHFFPKKVNKRLRLVQFPFSYCFLLATENRMEKFFLDKKILQISKHPYSCHLGCLFFQSFDAVIEKRPPFLCHQVCITTRYIMYHVNSLFQLRLRPPPPKLPTAKT